MGKKQVYATDAKLTNNMSKIIKVDEGVDSGLYHSDIKPHKDLRLYIPEMLPLTNMTKEPLKSMKRRKSPDLYKHYNMKL